MQLQGKTALVTGAGRGIGKGCALELARCGANLVINDRPGSPDLQTTKSEIEQLGRECSAVEADVFSRTGCQQLLDATVEATQNIDILVSNPAVSIRTEFLDYDPDDFERTINGTLISGFHISQLVARQMVESGANGKIVFISSVHSFIPSARCVAYNAAKAGLNHMAQTIAVELSQHRINVNVIEPGWIDTPGEHQTFSEETIEHEGNKLPWGRLGTPADIGKAAAFLASENADYITGSVLRVDGGFWFKNSRAEEVIPPTKRD